jgi:hypothetical protein
MRPRASSRASDFQTVRRAMTQSAAMVSALGHASPVSTSAREARQQKTRNSACERPALFSHAGMNAFSGVSFGFIGEIGIVLIQSPFSRSRSRASTVQMNNFGLYLHRPARSILTANLTAPAGGFHPSIAAAGQAFPVALRPSGGSCQTPAAVKWWIDGSGTGWRISLVPLDLERELTHARFAEIGHPYRLFRDSARRLVAIGSSFGHLGWPGRTANEGRSIHHRISLYDDSLEQRIAVLNLSARWTIQDIAFHPTETKLLIGTGDYDGGFCFEGELLLWDWTSGETRSLLGERREVVRCRFNPDETITAILRPRDEEEYLYPAPESGPPSESDDLYVAVTITDEPPPPLSEDQDPRLRDLRPSDPRAAGFTIHPTVYPLDLPESEKSHLKDLGFQRHHIIRDLLWIDDEIIAVAHDGCHLELWSSHDECLASFSGPGHGVELLPFAEWGCLVNVIETGDYREQTRDRSTLLAYVRGEPTPLAAFDHACSVTSDAQGNILARDVEYQRGRPRRDAFLGQDGGIVFETDLGHYDTFNHSLRLQGEGLYFLRGTPPDSHLNKVLCTLDRDGRREELAAWDGNTWHLMSSLAVFVSDHHVVRAAEVYFTSSARASIIERMCPKTGKVLWRTPMEDGSFTALAAVPASDQVVYAQANGGFGLMDANSGKLDVHSPLTLDGVPTIVTALSVRNDRLAAGTIDGRILLLRIKAPLH